VALAKEEKREKGILVFDGDQEAWTPSVWSHGKYDLRSTLQNHTPGGNKSVQVQLPEGDWGAVQFAGPTLKPADFKTISMWVYPTGCDVEYRVRFELNGTQVGIERAVTAGPRHGWQVNQWNRVIMPLVDFQVPDSFNRIVINSNSSRAVYPFYLDDLRLGL
jgi:hypothetical protein